ncbi:endonuclease/exonuclease/phosphatase family protein [Gryllotalpicola daejeonensis]|uniref:Endonuclease/exonuclease/phosphatase family protein n=1 Tax=Gryllotalpicola daejeonensis TaxID=993087 RepID=A0ABP7ZG61_9MICO
MPARRPTRMVSDAVLGVVALAVGALLLWHGAISDRGGVMGLIESVLPWFGILIVLFAIVAATRRSAFIAIGALVSAIVWAALYVPVITPHRSTGNTDFTVISENVDADNTNPANTVESIAARHPQVIALQELTADSAAAASKTLDAAYPHHYVVGTVGVWSSLPLSNAHSLTLGLGWKRALSVDVQTDAGPVRVYALHAASLRPGEFAQRDEMLSTLAATLRRDDSSRLIAVGDFNAASTDRAFRQLLDTVNEPGTSQWGFGFTWPARFPVARVDHVVERGLHVVSNVVLPPNGSDHRPIQVGLGRDD